MPAAPLTNLIPAVAEAPPCDVPGCGAPADFSTDGTEVDSNPTTKDKGRKSLPYVNLDKRHENWSFSEDAQEFSRSKDYLKRVRDVTAAANTSAPVPPAAPSTVPSGKAK